jgi:hypothetical protein
LLLTLSETRDLIVIVGNSLVIAAGLVFGGRKVIESTYPLFRPALTAARNRVLRDVLERLGILERRVDIIEAIQQHDDRE